MAEVINHSLQRSNLRLAQLIASLEGGVLVEDETRHISLINQSFCDLFAIPLSPQALIGTDCSANAEASKHLFVDSDAFVRRIDTILAERKHVINETLHLVDGRVFARDYIPVFDANEYIGHLWHYRDVTQTIQLKDRLERLLQFEAVNKEINRLFLQVDDTDEALNRSLEITGHLLDVSRVYVFRFRENERIVDNTHEWCAVGVKPEKNNLQAIPFDELLPSFFPMMAERDLIAPYHINELPDDLRGILEPQDVQTVLWMPMYLNNRVEGFVGYDETRYPRHWLPEEITLARIVMESYSRALERDQASAILVKARDEAVRTAQLRAQFVANMSHEIRTPMTGILGMLELLLETQLDELQKEFAAEAFKSSSNLLTIINDILDFSKLEAGQIVLEAKPIDLKAILTEVKMTLAPQLKSKPIEINLTIDPQTPYRVFGDATRIRQVLMNLAGNAVKFTHQGQVTLSIDVIQIKKEIAYLKFSVKDTGIGIAQKHLNHIFDSFVQADGSTTRKYGGSGLGLSISKQLVELMGSTIEVESTPNEGSVFSFMIGLPVAPSTNIDETMVAQFAQLRVLLVDSNRTARYVLAQQLENWSVTVTQVDQMEGLHAVLAGQRFDLAFCRCEHMPKETLVTVSGYAANVILLTSTPTTQPVQELNGYVQMSSPINQSALYNLLIGAASVHPLSVTEQPSSHLAIKRVLLVDDSLVNIDLANYALIDAPVQVDYATNGQEALQKLQEHSYDLILMDIQMPIMDGLEATRRIRQSSERYRSIPIIALTASVMQDEQDNYLAVGIDAVVSKPFSIKYLRQTAMEWLAKSSD